MSSLQAEFKGITVKQMPHPMYIMPRAVTFLEHVPMPVFVGVVKFDETELRRKQPATFVNRSRDYRLLDRTIGGIR